VSTWRFWSGKEINFSRRHPFRLIVLLGLMFYALVNFSSYILPICFFAYLFSGVVARAAYSAQRRRKRRLGRDGIESGGGLDGNAARTNEIDGVAAPATHPTDIPSHP
jgi:hypothetical protein